MNDGKTAPPPALKSQGDRLFLKKTAEIFWRRYFPVLSLAYVSTVAGMAARQIDFVDSLLHDKKPYVMALFVALWISIPALIWIAVRCVGPYERHADNWFKISAVLMIAILILSHILFPEANTYGLRTYFAATVPLLIVMYFFFVRGGLPAAAAHPLSALGLTFLFYGAAIGFLY